MDNEMARKKQSVEFYLHKCSLQAFFVWLINMDMPILVALGGSRIHPPAQNCPWSGFNADVGSTRMPSWPIR